MKTMYYITPTLVSTHQVSDDLHEAGVKDWFIHVISKDESGLSKEHVHSSNYLETLDLVRDGVIGAMIGFFIGVIAAGLLMYIKPFGPNVPEIVYLFIILLLTLFGSWEGGLMGIASKNKKLAKFDSDLDAGKYLVLIYAKKGQGRVVKSTMSAKHPEAELVATDSHFLNPFSSLERI